MRKVVMIFEVEDTKRERDLKSEVMRIAEINKAKLKRFESKSLNKQSGADWKYPSNFY